MTNDRIIRKPELLKMIGVSHPTIWRWEKDGTFPKRIQLGCNSCGWLESEIKKWFDIKSEGRNTQINKTLNASWRIGEDYV